MQLIEEVLDEGKSYM